MARPTKTGLDYFNVDVVFDENLECLISLYGAQALLVMIRFWQMAYRTENGEVSYSGVIRRIISKTKFNAKTASDEKKLEQIFASAIEFGLLDGDAYKKGILTSHGVKKRLGVISQVREKARERQAKKSYSANNHEEHTNKNSYSTKRNTKESKGKKRKVKERRERERRKSVTNESSQSLSFFSPPKDKKLFSEDDMQKLFLKLGEEQAQFWAEEVQLACERNPEEFLSKCKSPVAMALSWARRCVADGKIWDAATKTYQKSNGAKKDKTAKELANGARLILDEQEKRILKQAKEMGRC